MDRILVSRKMAGRLTGLSDANIRNRISRGRLVEGDALIGGATGTVRKGITLVSLVAYCGWSQMTVDDILVAHGVDPDSAGWHYLCERDEA
ncbi:MAG: hypothetical protein OXI15_03130 [Chromatiales bacterium]|nr:hypothetical protein [Chromatiales bacterium]